MKMMPAVFSGGGYVPVIKKEYFEWLFSELTDLVYPRRCPFCDRVLSSDEHKKLICSECEEKPKYIHSPYCFKCGKQLSDPDEEYCEDCRKRSHSFVRGVALYDYSSVRMSMYRFKYSGRAEYAEYFGRELAYSFGDLFRKWEIDAIVPVPMYSGKERVRGYNQAEKLAESIARESGIPVFTGLVKRVKNTKPMKMLGAGERAANLKNAFIIASNDVKFNKVLLVDDIYTTGATIDAVADALMDAGVSYVYFVTLSIGAGC